MKKLMIFKNEDNWTYRTTTDRVNDQGVVVRPKGTIMYAYVVDGTPEQLAEYKEAMGDMYREYGLTKEGAEDPSYTGRYKGYPVYTTQERIEQPRELVITRRGTVARTEDEQMLKLQSAMKKANALGEGVVNAMGAEIAKFLLGDATQKRAVQTLNPEEAVAKTVEEDNLDGL